MKKIACALVLLILSFACGVFCKAEDPLAMVRQAVSKSELDREGTHPFHLKAALQPSFARDASSQRTGEIEIWWAAPGVYRLDLGAPGFHQMTVLKGGHTWQRNEGDYLPEWLHEIAEGLLHPVPKEAAALQGTAPDQTRILGGNTYLNWEKPLPMDKQPPKERIVISNASGLLFYDGGLGWGCLFKDYQDFHGKMIPRTVTHGNPEVSAKITLLEDLPAEPSDWFDPGAQGESSNHLKVMAIPQTDLSRDVASSSKVLVWPALTSSPRSGVIWADVVVDQSGAIREPFQTISDNPGLNSFTHEYLSQLRFKPVLSGDVPTQSVRHVVLRFELPLPPGTQDLGTARDSFSRGRNASDLSSGSELPYLLRGTIKLNLGSGEATGTYTDAWKDSQHWKREVVIGENRAIRSRDGEKQYRNSEGPMAKVAQLVLTLVEPIPADDTMTESDWRVDADVLSGQPAIRVLRGRVEDGKAVDPKLATVFWFSQPGLLQQAYASNFAVSYVGYREFQGSAYPRTILVRSQPEGGVAVRIDFDEPSLADATSFGTDSFKVPGHEWTRQFTAETR